MANEANCMSTDLTSTEAGAAVCCWLRGTPQCRVKALTSVVLLLQFKQSVSQADARKNDLEHIPPLNISLHGKERCMTVEEFICMPRPEFVALWAVSHSHTKFPSLLACAVISLAQQA